ncbi:hypothetical protein HY091_02165 [Candidatus Kaiserbacteria bacterium]|nr:hypothetical protein [Candidatus Kaiserbacteria bacterium]
MSKFSPGYPYLKEENKRDLRVDAVQKRLVEALAGHGKGNVRAETVCVLLVGFLKEYENYHSRNRTKGDALEIVRYVLRKIINARTNVKKPGALTCSYGDPRLFK